MSTENFDILVETSTLTNSYFGNATITPETMENVTEILYESWSWGWKEIAKGVPFYLIALSTIIGNLLALYSFLRRPKSQRVPTHYFIANLSLADFLVGTFVTPFLATSSVLRVWIFGRVYCEIWTFMHFWLCTVSILSTCSVCVERYVGVRFPLKHKNILSTKRLRLAIAFVWIFAAVLASCSLYIWRIPGENKSHIAQNTCGIHEQIGYVVLVVTVLIYAMLAVMLVFYWMIFRIASEHIRNQAKFAKGQFSGHSNSSNSSTESTTISMSMSRSSISISGSEDSLAKIVKSSGSSASNSKDNSDLKEKQLKLAKRLSLLVFVIIMAYVPFFTLYTIFILKPGFISLEIFAGFTWIRYSSSAVNPLIYAFAIPGYKEPIVKLFRRIWCKK